MRRPGLIIEKLLILNPEDSKLYYKMALTYINEEQWESAVKQLESAMRIHKNLA